MHIRTFKKASRQGCLLDENIPVSDVIKLFRIECGHHQAATEKNYNQFEELMNKGSVHFKVHAIGIRTDTSNELIFGGIVIEFGKRLYYVMGASTETGRNSRATISLLTRWSKNLRIPKRYLILKDLNYQMWQHFFSDSVLKGKNIST